MDVALEDIVERTLGSRRRRADSICIGVDFTRLNRVERPGAQTAYPPPKTGEADEDQATSKKELHVLVGKAEGPNEGRCCVMRRMNLIYDTKTVSYMAPRKRVGRLKGPATLQTSLSTQAVNICGFPALADENMPPLI
ncbi:hypothetical protein BYT27DRAFT_7264889 [Phlegmacium glaucopus]|nr:hypothetical protein BYT27DRAFT_7264889 [Phlegmacium glaucopus]